MQLPAHRIEVPRTAIARIVAGLFALLGLTAGSVPERIPLALHRAIRRVLRPAESAVRRLIVVLARITAVTAPPPRPRPMPAAIVRTGQAQSRAAFQLFDPRQRFFQKRRKPKPAGPGPRITFFEPGGGYRSISFAPPPPPPSDGLENSAHIVLRLQALQAALADLPRQAKRLVRVLARRQNIPQLQLRTPLRPGRPPGNRQKPRLEVDHVLRECDWLARNALPPDTS